MPILRSTLEVMRVQFDKATCPEDIFGDLPNAGDATTRKRALQRKFAPLTRACHPDLAEPPEKELAGTVSGKLMDWKREADDKLKSNTYGDRKTVKKPAPPAASYVPVTLRVGRRDLTLTSLLGKGAFSTVHRAELAGNDPTKHSVFVKIANNPADNDLLDREMAVLKKMRTPHPAIAAEEFLGKQRQYIPFPVQSFYVNGDKGEKHRAIVLTVPAFRCFTVTELRERDQYKNGIEPVHAYWIFRRLLLTLWMAHLNGVVHGAVTPDHVLVYPKEHGLVLLDWTCATDIYAHVKAYDKASADYYPPELLKRAPATPAFDIYMVAMTAITMLGGEVTSKRVPILDHRIESLLLSCLQVESRRRPQDAEEFHNRFGKMLEAVHGPRKYVEMIVR